MVVQKTVLAVEVKKPIDDEYVDSIFFSVSSLFFSSGLSVSDIAYITIIIKY
jgi:hypothetical protein